MINLSFYPWASCAPQVAFVAVLLHGAVLCAAPDRGLLRVLVTDQSGAPVQNAQVEVSSVSRSVRYSLASGSRELSLEYDTYRIAASAVGFQNQHKLVKVYGPDVFAVISLPLGTISGRPSYRSLRGRIVGRRFGGNSEPSAYVKLIPVFGQVGAEAAIDSDGKFVIWEFEPGEHILLLVIDERVVVQRQVRLVRNQEVVEISVDR